MTEEKDTFVQEKSQWESPHLESRSIEEETLGNGNFMGDADGESADFS
jgi:hypothetical protein